MVIDTSAKTRPKPSAISPASSLDASPTTAPASASCCPDPGETDSMVRATTREGRSESMSAASPVSASRNGTTASAAWSASARLWLKPSP